MKGHGKLGPKARAQGELRLPKTVELSGVITKENGVSFVSDPHISVTQFFSELRRCPFIADFTARYQVEPNEIDTVLRAANLLVMETFTGKRLLTGAEVAHQLRRALAGEVPIRLANPRFTWDLAYCTNCRVFVGDWEFIFYNDAGCLDYIDTVIAPDGRWAQFRDFWDGENPLFCGGGYRNSALLGLDEKQALERLLEAAK